MRTPLATIKKIRTLSEAGGKYISIAREVGVDWSTARAHIRNMQGRCGWCNTPNSNGNIRCDECLYKMKLKRNK